MHPQLPASERFLPESYRDTVARFAAAARLDTDSLLQGQRFDYRGTAFRLESYGHMDPDGLFLLVEVGEFSDENAASVCKRLLELNMLVPAARLGYYTVMPGSNLAMYCMRFDLLQTADAHEFIAAAIESLTSELQRTVDELSRAAEKSAGTTAMADVA